VCDHLGVAPERVQVLWGDSDALGAGRGNGGSGALTVGGSAVTRATEKVIERGRRIAARLLEAAPDDVIHQDGKFTVKGTDKGVTFANVARAAYVPRQLPQGMEPGFSEEASFTPSAVTFTNELGQSRTVHPTGKQESLEIEGSLLPVRTPLGDAWILSAGKAADDIARCIGNRVSRADLDSSASNRQSHRTADSVHADQTPGAQARQATHRFRCAVS